MSTRKNKPTPKSQKQISNEQFTPYTSEGTDPSKSGNLNRGDQLSLKGDTTKPFTIGIQDIDEAIYYYFTNVIKPFTIQNGTRIEVPIVYANPERWKSIQKDGYYRDKNGKLMSPLIVFKRDNLSKVRNIGNKLDANFPNLYSSFTKGYSKKNFYNQFDILNETPKEKEIYAIVIPDYVQITYSCIIYTYYMEQMNKIVEAINYASDSYWGDPSRFKFNARIDSFNTVVEVTDGTERTVKSNFEIKLNGYIIPDIIQKDATALKKSPSVTKIIFGIETTINPNNKPSL